MLKVFSHYLPTHTLQQVLFDALMLFAVVLAAVCFARDPEARSIGSVCISSALTFAACMISLNAAMGTVSSGVPALASAGVCRAWRYP